MASNRTRRIAKEIADIRADASSQITAEPVGGDGDITHLRGSFPGPPGTPYEGGTYKIDIRIPTEYPFRPPSMKFETKVWHPNVSSQTVSSLRYHIYSVCLIPNRVQSVSTRCLPHGPPFLQSGRHCSRYSPYSVPPNPRIPRMPR